MVDTYDALTTTRPYKRAFTAEQAFGLLRAEVRKGGRLKRWWRG